MNAIQMFYTTIAAIAIAGILNWRTGERLDKKIDALRSEMKGDINSLRIEIQSVRTELLAAIERLRAEMIALHERVTRVEEHQK